MRKSGTSTYCACPTGTNSKSNADCEESPVSVELLGIEDGLLYKYLVHDNKQMTMVRRLEDANVDQVKDIDAGQDALYWLDGDRKAVSTSVFFS